MTGIWKRYKKIKIMHNYKYKTMKVGEVYQPICDKVFTNTQTTFVFILFMCFTMLILRVLSIINMTFVTASLFAITFLSFFYILYFSNAASVCKISTKNIPVANQDNV